jgi:hypothetical protein
VGWALVPHIGNNGTIKIIIGNKDEHLHAQRAHDTKLTRKPKQMEEMTNHMHTSTTLA